MRTGGKVFQQLKNQFAIPVLRVADEKELEKISLTLIDCGFTVLEITLMSPVAFKVIEKLAKIKNVTVGAGTVLTIEQGLSAAGSGASFLVSPGYVAAVNQAAQNAKIPYLPGVLTPSEIMTAWNLGIEMVKVFPVAAVGGPQYVKSLKGPFPKLKCMVTGGIKISDLKSYHRAGATCVGLGSDLLPAPKRDRKLDSKALARNARDILRQVSEL